MVTKQRIRISIQHHNSKRLLLVAGPFFLRSFEFLQILVYASLTGWLQSVYLPLSEAFRRLIEFDVSLLIQERYSMGVTV